jgi:mannose/fructose/N-acetylgalactosamine-specific phosphotransferase system component IID
MSKISRFDLFRIYLRSFFVQNGWSYERMLGMGMVWILKPMATKLFDSVGGQKSFLKRHLLSFNANPYLSNYALGALVKLEENGVPEEQVVRFKDTLQGPLGAWGDSLIWQNLRPALLILGLIFCMTIGAGGALIFWLMFNLYQAYLRARGIIKGYALGLGLSSELTKGYLPHMTRWSGRMGAVVLGFLLVIKSCQIARQSIPLENIPLLAGFVGLSVLAFKKNLNPNYTLLLSVALFLVIKTLILLI